MSDTYAIDAGRLRSVDIIRGVALIFMVVNHFGQTLSGGGFHSPLALFINVTGIFPAPLFFILVGISIVLVNHRFQSQDVPPRKVWKRVLLRSLLILGMGYLFAIVMFGWTWVLDWSVLQLIGFSLIICQLTLQVPYRYRIVLIGSFTVLAPFFRFLLNYEAIVGTVDNLHYQPPITLLDHLSAMLATGKVPLLPWMACPLIGTLIGEAFIAQPTTPRRLVKVTGGIGTALCLSVIPLFFLVGDGVTQYPLTTGFFLLSTGLSLIVIAIVVTTVDLWRWWNPASRFCEINGQIALITYIAHHLYGPFFIGKILGFWLSLEIVGLTLVILTYFTMLIFFSRKWLPFRQSRSSYWDIAVSYALLLIGLAIRLIFILFGIWRN